MDSRKDSGLQSMTTVLLVIALMFLLLDSVVASSRFLPNLPGPDVNSSTPGLAIFKSHQKKFEAVRSLLSIPAPALAPSPGSPFGPGVPPPNAVQSLLPIPGSDLPRSDLPPSPGTPPGSGAPPPDGVPSLLLTTPAPLPASPGTPFGPGVPPP